MTSTLPSEPAASSQNAVKRALLIGIRTYPLVPPTRGGPLAGCHNDVAIVREILLLHGFLAANIEVMIDRLDDCSCCFCEDSGSELSADIQVPTRAAILQGVEDLAEACGDSDVAVLYYSGHGSEIHGSGLLAGQRCQTLVPHDSGRGDAENRDILDRDVAGWRRLFATRTPYLTMIFDCCHSGGVGDLRGAVPQGRQVAADDRDESCFAAELRSSLAAPAEIESFESEPSAPATAAVRGGGQSAIVLSASAARELSSETVVAGRKHGLFTHHLCRLLQVHAGATDSWAEIFEEIAQAVNEENLSQHPRREGNGPIFAAGVLDLDDVYPADVLELDKFAVVIGIDYDPSEDADAADKANDKTASTTTGFSALRTPRRDAEEVARVLEEVQGYEIVGLSQRSPGPLLNTKATRQRIHKVIHRLIDIKARTRRETAVVIYFAGHGMTRTLADGSSAGYLIPWGADRDDPSTWLPMKDLRDQLVDGIRDAERLASMEQSKPLRRLTSRHLLLVLDCCFGGALAYDFFRGSAQPDRPIYYSEYKRFIEGPAWQLLTSASHNQQAMDRNPSNPLQPYSPFAQAIIEGLSSDRADAHRGSAHADHLITADELHAFVDRRLQQMGVDIQTPGLMALRPVQGQFIFQVPGYSPSPLPDPPIDPAANPWRELLGSDLDPDSDSGPVDSSGSGSSDATELYFGRELATLGLLDRFLKARAANHRCGVAVTGGSGSGKTALVRLGLLPVLEDPVVQRRRLRSFARRAELNHLLISRQDLTAVRQWLMDLSLGARLQACQGRDSSDSSDSSELEELAQLVTTWAQEQGLLSGGGASSQASASRQMAHLGMPSFDSDSAGSATCQWFERLQIATLLQAPAELAERLAAWQTKGGLADFMSVSDRALRGLIGRWQWQAESLPEDSGDSGDSRDSYQTLRVVDPWVGENVLSTSQEDVLVVVASEGPSPGSTTGEQWLVFEVPRPTRAELREVILGPAGARVLFFEPESLVDELVGAVEALPAPLAVLSDALRQMYDQAWQRRQDADRKLLAADLPCGGIGGMLARRCEEAYLALRRSDPEAGRLARSVLLRTVSWNASGPARQPECRAVSREECRFPDAPQQRRFEQQVLPWFVQQRVLVAEADHLLLAAPQILGTWLRMRRWLRYTQRHGIDLQEVWRQASAWRASGFLPDKTWFVDAEARGWFRSGLNELESAFLIASEMERFSVDALTCAARAQMWLFRDWCASAGFAVQAADLALQARATADEILASLGRSSAMDAAVEAVKAAAIEATIEARQLTFSVAEQILHLVVAATPRSVPLVIPLASSSSSRGCQISALAMEDGELRVRLTWPQAESKETALVWDLDNLMRAPRQVGVGQAPPPGSGQILPKRHLIGPDEDFPVVSGPRAAIKAQAGHDSTIRFFVVDTRRSPLAAQRVGRPPQALLGHRAVPRFLVFSEAGDWLVSAANRVDAAPELRLWPILDGSELLTQPKVHAGRRLSERVPKVAFDERRRMAGRQRLPGRLFCSAGEWRVQKMALDGSFFELLDVQTGQCSVLNLSRAVATKPEGHQQGRRFSLPKLAKLRPPLPAPLDSPMSDCLPKEIQLSHDGRWLTATTARGDAWLWSLPDRSLVDRSLVDRSLPDTSLPGMKLRWSTNERTEENSEKNTARGAKGATKLEFSEDGRWLAGLEANGKAWLRSLTDFSVAWQSSGSEEFVALVFNPAPQSGPVLALADSRGLPRFVDPGRCDAGSLYSCAPTIQDRNEFSGSRVSTLAFSGDGRRLAMGYRDGMVRIWPVRQEAPVSPRWRPLELPSNRREGLAVRALAFQEAGHGEQLAVERRAVYAPHHCRVEVYQLQLETLRLLALGHAGEASDCEGEEKLRYLTALGVSAAHLQAPAHGESEDEENR